MKPHLRKSLKRNKSRRNTQFKPGHQCYHHRESVGVTFSESRDISVTNSPLTSHSRIRSCEFPDVVSVASSHSQPSGSSPGIITYRLRPGKEKKYTETSKQRTTSADNENIIVNLKKLEDLFKEFAPHSCKAKNSESVRLNIVERQGLCISVSVTCKNCGYKTPKCALFTTMKPERGPDAGCINSMVLLPVVKSRVGLNDVNLLLSCLNIKPQNIRVLQKKLNKLTDRIEALNKKQMIENQLYVKRIQSFAGLLNHSEVEYDVSYSSRPAQGCERATQSFAPLIEQATTKHLPISIETANKLCTKQNCEHNTNSCKRNYNPQDSIQSCESKLLKKNLNAIHGQNILKVRSVTTDASTQIAKALREYNASGNYSVKHYKCFIHRMRSFHSKVKELKLNSVPREYDKQTFAQKLASSLRARIRLELSRYRKSNRDDAQYLQKAKLCMENVLSCFQGKHSSCREKSLVCEAHLKSYTTKDLPYGKHIQLSSVDIDRVNTVLKKYVGPDCLREMARLSNTNQCESLHGQVFRCAPKHTVWSRNFTGLCHSVAHSASLGTGESLMKIAAGLGLPISQGDPFCVHMKNLDSVSRYHARVKSTTKYKSLRYIRRKQRSNRKLLQVSMYGGDPQIDAEHDYGLSPMNR